MPKHVAKHDVATGKRKGTGRYIAAMFAEHLTEIGLSEPIAELENKLTRTLGGMY